MTGKITAYNTVHNLLLVDFSVGKSSDTSNAGCFLVFKSSEVATKSYTIPTEVKKSP